MNVKPLDPMTGKQIRTKIHFSEIATPRIIVHAGAVCGSDHTCFVSSDWKKVSCKRCLKTRSAK